MTRANNHGRSDRGYLTTRIKQLIVSIRKHKSALNRCYRMLDEYRRRREAR